MKIYTRTGDAGETGLFGGGRVPKDHIRVEAYGSVDELSSSIGVAIAVLEDEEVRSRLETLQPDLFAIGAHLATPPVTRGKRPTLPPLPIERIEAMESWIDSADTELPPLRAFIMPGGSPAGAALHHARTVCRRAERRVISLAAVEPVEADLLRYLNRLSDLLFALARLVNKRADVPEREWLP